jgi:tRNA(Ser,Leu) C12 N-acetylase TAN1
MSARRLQFLGALPDWNVVVSVHEHSFARARRILAEYGIVAGTEFRNVLVMKVASPEEFLASIALRCKEELDFLAYVSRIAPATETFDFRTPEEFETKARPIVASWAPQLVGKKFHVRVHRRGLKGVLSSQYEERLLDETLLQALKELHGSGTVRFENADAVIDVETLGHRAGLALWSREDLERYPFLKPE